MGCRRVEVSTGPGRRRRFTTAGKLDLVAQMDRCDNIGEFARRHDLRPSQLFTWRCGLRYAVEMVQGAAAVSEPMFVRRSSSFRASRSMPAEPGNPGGVPVRPTAVELVINGVAVKIARGADAAGITAVIDALKA